MLRRTTIHYTQISSFICLLLFTVSTLLSACQLHDLNLESTSVRDTDLFPVTKIVDGDTFWVDNGTEKGLKIRFIGIDAPESRRMFDQEVEYFGPEAKNYLNQLLSGKRVRLVYDVDPLDRYGRQLCYVYLEDGTFVNAEIIRNGYAALMTIPPNVAFAELFQKLQVEARENKRGLWGNVSE